MPHRPSLADPRFHRALASMVRKRVPESDADDIVQSVLTDALASKTAPEDPDAMRKWVFAVAKNKIADFYRKRRREEPSELADIPAEETPYSERDLLRWAERELPPNSESPKTLEWMLREGDGEKLESIAESEQIPAPRVRQRVSRMRRFLKERWVATALAGTLVVITIIVILLKVRPSPQPDVAVTPEIPRPTAPVRDPRLELAGKERKDALDKCDHSEWQPCLDGLDRAAVDDPTIEADPRVIQARKAAGDALKPTPAPSPSTTSAPSPTSTPTSSPTVTSTPPAPTFKPKPTLTSTPSKKSSFNPKSAESFDSDSLGTTGSPGNMK